MHINMRLEYQHTMHAPLLLELLFDELARHHSLTAGQLIGFQVGNMAACSGRPVAGLWRPVP